MSYSSTPTHFSRRANGGELPVRQRLWENASIQKRKRIPLMRRFRLEVPEHPSLSVTFEGLKLSFDVASHITFHVIVPRFNVGLPVAGAYVSRIGIGSIVASANIVAIERRSTISLRSRPFADDNPLVCSAGVRWCVVADKLTVLPVGHGDELISKDLIFVMINNDFVY
jgi:hypothetical protein